MVTIQKEILCEVAGEVDVLLHRHWMELCQHRDRKVLAPRWDQYAAMERAGLLFTVTARDAGKLIGYSCFFVMPHMHYEAYTVATNDVLFLDEPYRGGPTGVRMIKRSEQEAKAMGADHIVWRAKLGTTLASILPRLGNTPEEVAMGKTL